MPKTTSTKKHPPLTCAQLGIKDYEALLVHNRLKNESMPLTVKRLVEIGLTVTRPERFNDVRNLSLVWNVNFRQAWVMIVDGRIDTQSWLIDQETSDIDDLLARLESENSPVYADFSDDPHLPLLHIGIDEESFDGTKKLEIKKSKGKSKGQ